MQLSYLQNTSLRLPTILEILALLVLSILAYVIRTFIIKPLTSPLRDLPGPPDGWGSNGHVETIMDLYRGGVHEWITTYGKTFLVRGPFGVHHRIFTLDPRAITHVFNNTSIYVKSPLLRKLIRRFMKNGLVSGEGDRHKLQRKVAQRLFSRNGLKGMTEVVEEKALQFRDIIQNLLTDSQFSTPYSTTSETLPTGSRELDIYSAISRCTFDIIGQIGIDHIFDSIGEWEGHGGELFEKYEAMQNPPSGFSFFLGVMFPWYDKIFPSENAKLVAEALNPIEELSKNMMVERQKEINQGKRELSSDNRDLLTLMLRSNMSKETTPEQRLTDNEIIGQLATFMFAGSDTTAGSIAMGLYQLAKHPNVQDTLRSELSNYGDNLSFEQIDELPYLDAVVKEVLRLNPSIPSTIREVTKDDIIPLSESVKLKNGKIVNELKIRKGQQVHIPIEHLHTCKEIWGEDAEDFNPSRFLGIKLEESKTPIEATFPNSPNTLGSIPESDQVNIKRRSSVPLNSLTTIFSEKTNERNRSSSISYPHTHTHTREKSQDIDKIDNIPKKTSIPSNVPSGPGVWPNFLSFIDGPRRCIGYKLALIEIKIFCFVLLKEFQVVPKDGIKVWRWNLLSTRPYVEGTLYSKGSSLPIIFKQCKGDVDEISSDE